VTYRIFLDASVLLAAAGSQHGGSSLVMSVLLGSDEYETLTSTIVELESRINLHLKFSPLARLRFRSFVGELMPVRVDLADVAPPTDLPASVASKDSHVLAACLAVGASICLTLDRRHLLTEDVRAWGTRHGVQFFTPGEFLEWHRRRAQRG
jgi:predicted nucleic acid-binding protein